MKSTANIRNLKKLTATACAVMLLSTGSYTQPGPGVHTNYDLNADGRLEQLMLSTEHSIRFVAPPVNDIYAEEAVSAGSEKTCTPADEKFESASVSKETENQVYLVESTQQRKIQVRPNRRNNQGLIQVGYYRIARATLWSKLRNIVTTRPPAKRNAGYKVIATSYIVNTNNDSVINNW